MEREYVVIQKEVSNAAGEWVKTGQVQIHEKEFAQRLSASYDPSRKRWVQLAALTATIDDPEAS